MPRVSVKVDVDGELLLLGRAIRKMRSIRALSQEELADSAEIDRSHMGKIERGERNVSVLNLLRIARALEISLAELIANAHL